MQTPDFFHQSIEFYHGRVPFIIVSLIDRLRELHAEINPSIFKASKASDNLTNLIQELSLGEIQKLRNYDNVSTLSIALVRFLDSITKENPLFTQSCRDNLLRANLTVKSSDCESIFRKNMENLYPGSYRTILTITDFLKNIESASLDTMFYLFERSFFGTATSSANRKQLRTIFILLLIHHQTIFNGAILGQAAYLNPQQIKMLQRRVNRAIQSQPEAITERKIALSLSDDQEKPHEIIKHEPGWTLSDDEEEEVSKTTTQEQTVTSEDPSKTSNLEEEENTYSSKTSKGKKQKCKPKKNSKKKKAKINKNPNSPKGESTSKSESQVGNSENVIPTKSESQVSNSYKDEQTKSESHATDNDSHSKSESQTNVKYSDIALQAVCLTMTPIKKIIHYEGPKPAKVEVEEKVDDTIETESSLNTGLDFFNAAVDAIQKLAKDEITFSQATINVDDSTF